MNSYKYLFLFLSTFLPLCIHSQTDTLYLNACDQPVKDKNAATSYNIRTAKRIVEQHQGFYLTGTKKYLKSYKKLPFADKNEVVIVGYTTMVGQKITTDMLSFKRLDSIFYNSGSFMEWFENGDVKTVSSYFGGKLHGDLITYHPNRKIKRKEVYHLDTLKSSRCFDSLGNDIPTSIYYTKAAYAEGEKAMFQFIGKNIVYDREDRERGIGGTVGVEISICEDNTVKDIRIKSSVTKNLDTECLRVVRLLKKWKAAQKEGVNIASVYVLHFTFKLE
jgi:TonB family protein